jgi:hypothetical protein
MGASLVYLEKPNKEIEFDVGENAQFKFAAGGMQGWRINMVSTEKCKYDSKAEIKLKYPDGTVSISGSAEMIRRTAILYTK